MKLVRIIFLCLLSVPAAWMPAAAAEQPLFGPVKYDVKDRYGKQNRYTATFPAKDAVYVIKLQNGATPGEKVDWWEFSVNGEKVVRNDKYFHSYFAVFVKLKAENTIEIMMRDDYPTALRRPPATPKNVTVTVFPVAAPAQERLRGSFGIQDWNQLNDYMNVILKVSGAALPLAMESLSVQQEMTRRTEAARKLAEMKDKSTEGFFERVFGDMTAASQIRAEAAVALAMLGDKKHIPLLMFGFNDPDEMVSVASARALALYPEQDTKDLLTKTLEKLDNLRKDSAIRAIVKGGWKPVASIITLAESSDPHVSEVALGVLGGMQVGRATDYLLAALENPGKRVPGQIIRALGDTKDPRAVEALLARASDKSKRSGYEIELADALATLGDQRGASVIQDMAKQAMSPQVEGRLRAAYLKLTGKEL